MKLVPIIIMYTKLKEKKYGCSKKRTFGKFENGNAWN